MNLRTVKNEPVIVAGSIAGIVSAVIIMLVSFGLIEWTPTQQQDFLTVIVLVAPIITAFFARSQVTPVKDPQIKTYTGEIVPLVRADTQLPPKGHVD